MATTICGGEGVVQGPVRGTRKVVEEELPINTGPTTMDEIMRAIRKMGRNTAAGPDGIPAEFFKEVDEERAEQLTVVLNPWWEDEDIPEAALTARVVLIFKTRR